MMSTLASRAEAGIELWIFFENDRLVFDVWECVFQRGSQKSKNYHPQFRVPTKVTPDFGNLYVSSGFQINALVEHPGKTGRSGALLYSSKQAAKKRHWCCSYASGRL